MARTIAVLFVHGVEASDADPTVTATRLLREEFAAAAPEGAELVVGSAFWAPVLRDRENAMVRRLAGDGALVTQFLDLVRRAGDAVSRGSVSALLGLSAAGLLRLVPGARGFHWPVLRWLLLEYVGDAVAYQQAAVYREVHAVIAAKLAELAREAGPDARLCVVAHSLGSVVPCDFFHDRQCDGAGDTPLERGETLAALDTLGCPMALTTLGLTPAELDRPLRVPHPALDLGGAGGWRNVWDPDDVLATPLSELSPHYATALVDQRVRLRPWFVGATPLTHVRYWNDRGVMRGIAERLAEVAR